MQSKVPIKKTFFKGFSTVGAKEKGTLNPYFFDASQNFNMNRALTDSYDNYERLLEAMKDKSKVKRVTQAIMLLCGESEDHERTITLKEISSEAGLSKEKTRKKIPRINRHLKAAFLKSQGNSADCVLGQRSLEGYCAIKIKKGGVVVEDLLMASIIYGMNHEGKLGNENDVIPSWLDCQDHSQTFEFWKQKHEADELLEAEL